MRINSDHGYEYCKKVIDICRNKPMDLRSNISVKSIEAKQAPNLEVAQSLEEV